MRCRMEERIAMLRKAKTRLRMQLSLGGPVIIIFLAIALPLLALGGVFALLAKDNVRRGQSGSPGTASVAKQGRVTDPDD